GRPGPAGGTRPAVRAAVAVQGVQGGGGAHRGTGGGRVAPLPEGGGAGAAIRRGPARTGPRNRPGPVAGPRDQGPNPKATARGVDRARAHGPGERTRARWNPAPAAVGAADRDI